MILVILQIVIICVIVFLLCGSLVDVNLQVVRSRLPWFCCVQLWDAAAAAAAAQCISTSLILLLILSLFVDVYVMPLRLKVDNVCAYTLKFMEVLTIDALVFLLILFFVD